jgi:hypothetical protein
VQYLFIYLFIKIFAMLMNIEKVYFNFQVWLFKNLGFAGKTVDDDDDDDDDASEDTLFKFRPLGGDKWKRMPFGDQ